MRKIVIPKTDDQFRIIQEIDRYMFDNMEERSKLFTRVSYAIHAVIERDIEQGYNVTPNNVLSLVAEKIIDLTEWKEDPTEQAVFCERWCKNELIQNEVKHLCLKAFFDPYEWSEYADDESELIRFIKKMNDKRAEKIINCILRSNL